MARKRLCLLILLVGFTILAGVPGITRKAGAQVTNIPFALDFTVLSRHAPWYVALDKDYYKQEGLNVEIIPGKSTAQVIQALESGLAQFAFADVPGFILARSPGATRATLGHRGGMQRKSAANSFQPAQGPRGEFSDSREAESR